MKTRTLTKRPGNAVGASCAMAPRGPWARRFGGQCAELPHMQAPPGGALAGESAGRPSWFPETRFCNRAAGDSASLGRTHAN